jgi:hypothetical protein
MKSDDKKSKATGDTNALATSDIAVLVHRDVMCSIDDVHRGAGIQFKDTSHSRADVERWNAHVGHAGLQPRIGEIIADDRRTQAEDRYGF